MVIETNQRDVSFLQRLSEATSVPQEVVLEQALKLWAAARELDVEGPQNEEPSCAVVFPLGISEVYSYLAVSTGTVAHRDDIICSMHNERVFSVIFGC